MVVVVVVVGLAGDYRVHLTPYPRYPQFNYPPRPDAHAEMINAASLHVHASLPFCFALPLIG